MGFMNRRFTAVLLAGAFAALPIVVSNTIANAKTPQKNLVAQRPTTQALQSLPATGTASFKGTVSITKFGYNPETKQLLVSGVLNGTAIASDGVLTTLVNVPFRDIPSTLSRTSGGTKQLGSCQILFLDLGPIFLDVLGLQVDLSEIQLDITAVAGAGNLLGNLLCALVGLLDGGPFAAIQNLINQINAILAGL